MTQDSKRAVVEGNREDRISDLPRNIIYYICEVLSVQDAARTSVLSTSWRYIWTMLPNIVLDKLLCNKLAKKSQSFFKETVDKILLQHIGDIMIFVLDLSGTYLSSYADIDRWMHYATRNGVKELTLNIPYFTTYRLPSHIFNCPTLAYLELHNCVFKPPNTFLGFQNLIDLHLNEITFVPTPESCVINAPLLASLYLTYCNGTQYLNMVSPLLESLTVRQSHSDLELNCFTTCKYLTELDLQVDNPTHDERSTLGKLLFNLPTLEELTLGSIELELLSADTVSKRLPCTLNCLWYVRLGVCFGKMGQTSCALELIKSSPNLSKLEIWAYDTRDNAEAVLKYLGTPTCLERPLNQLKDVVIHWFNGSKTELLFVKLLLAHSPSLIRMSIKRHRAFDSEEERNITTELMRFPRASPKAELFYLSSVS